MLNPLGPTQVAHVHQPINAIFDFDEGAELGQITHSSFNGGAHGKFVMQRIPGIGCKLSHAQRNTSLLRVDVKHYAVHVIAHADELGGMLHTLGPGHLAHVY